MPLAALSDAPAPAANALPRAGVAARPHRAPLACSADPDQSARSATGQALFLMPLFALWPDFQSALKRRSEEHTSELQSRGHLVCRLLLEKKQDSLNALE